MMTEEWIDVSVPLRTGMVHWPDNPPVTIERTLDIGHGDEANVSKILMGAHTGTHMDAPLHSRQATQPGAGKPMTSWRTLSISRRRPPGTLLQGRYSSLVSIISQSVVTSRMESRPTTHCLVQTSGSSRASTFPQ
jgi:Putative cyclase